MDRLTSHEMEQTNDATRVDSICARLIVGSTRADEAEVKAIEAMTKLDATIARDEKAPGKPVVEVQFANTKVTDADRRLLANFKSLQTLGLAFTDVTDAGMKELAGRQIQSGRHESIFGLHSNRDRFWRDLDTCI